MLGAILNQHFRIFLGKNSPKGGYDGIFRFGSLVKDLSPARKTFSYFRACELGMVE